MERQDDIAGKSVQWIMEELRRDGYRLVEVAWRPSSIWQGPAWARTNACKYATFARWAYDNLHEEGLFAAQGNSGGSAQIAFSVAYYGIDDILDVVNLGGGPPPCPREEGGMNYTEQHFCTGGIGSWDESREPFLSGPAWFDYPTMTTNFFLGEFEKNQNVIVTVNTYHSLIESEKTMTTVPDTGHGVHKTPEGAEALVSALRDAVSDE